MATEIYLVKVGMNMTEGIVEEWYIADGDRVEKGELLYRLETEKVNLDVDAEASGIVKHVVAEGVTMEPGNVVGYIFEEGEEIPADLGTLSGGASATPAAPAAAAEPVSAGVDLTTLTGTGPGGRIVEADVQAAAAAQPAGSGGGPSSPMARKVARELGVDLNTVTGTGPGGRITKEDVERAAAAPAATSGKL